MNGSEVQRPMTPLGTARLGAAPLLKASFKLALEFQDRNGQDRNGLNRCQNPAGRFDSSYWPWHKPPAHAEFDNYFEAALAEDKCHFSQCSRFVFGLAS